jgi:hypothetical protein
MPGGGGTSKQRCPVRRLPSPSTPEWGPGEGLLKVTLNVVMCFFSVG